MTKPPDMKEIKNSHRVICVVSTTTSHRSSYLARKFSEKLVPEHEQRCEAELLTLNVTKSTDPTTSMVEDMCEILRANYTNPYRIMPLHQTTPKNGYDSVFSHCLGYDLTRVLNNSFLVRDGLMKVAVAAAVDLILLNVW